MTTVALTTLTPPVQASLRDLGQTLAGLYGEKLLCLAAYGSAVEKIHDPGQSGIETVMVLSQVDLAMMRSLSQHGAKLGARGITAPLALTPDDIKASYDTFPLEIIEIHQSHVVVTGRDFFESVEIQPEHVRLQCEREFKRIMLRIRQGVLAAAGHEQILVELSRDIGRHVLRTLRGFLWTRGQREYLPADAILARCAKETGRPLTGLSSAIHFRGDFSWSEFTTLHQDVEVLARISNDG